MSIAQFAFDNTYARELEGFYVPWKGAEVPAPLMIRFNRDLAVELGLDTNALDSDAGAAIFAGHVAPEGASPLAMAYAGHQFGGFSPQLGDGRALLLGEVIDTKGERRDIHLKGSGRTPFSRGGDGKAVLGPVLREYVIGEAMHALGVPTTRALAAVTTGEQILRQDGPEPGAVLARVASSHLRVGTFQFFAARGETERLRQLADYAIARHYPELADRPDRYLGLLSAVRDRQAALIASWMHLGFVHGVMNTDNMTISGETIDYGPCAFIDAHDPAAVFSSIDSQGRYAYGNQPKIAQWNLARLAETLLDLINPDDSEHAVRQASEVINSFPLAYERAWLAGLRLKLGLTQAEEGDMALGEALLAIMHNAGADFTRVFRSLSSAASGDTGKTRALFDDPAQIEAWLEGYRSRLAQESGFAEDRAGAMDRVNPVYIPRNHMVEAALQSATRGDLTPFERLVDVLADPFTERAGLEVFALGAPTDFGPYTTFCGT
ncbi:MAG: YdiU family protein [Hoeflea sp.]|uniref:protein adenylyltransferase SelO n=1 Tax=Hoeflea sp. TaxID=1940281 RepID=UPI001DEEDE41|nr:YdiU family protein [Hoeflea sp.]MBU4530269.1 YdiU family protein [Alphaproteobacteria bacterium]MBU4545056.1 YdiU family protein [Alphaproteobacteria bacterium]MBU4549744.1 YdiU family protein [Alphaproteobacteria bacterium]MBV1721859.1 YdiU family protein [Hoeflea sp.]MBV1761209.1 YdiU family protein [Hoeflea sp.]